MSLGMWAGCGSPAQDGKAGSGPCQLKQQEARSFNETDDRIIWKSPETGVAECLVYEYPCRMQSVVMRWCLL